ncbi:hypothetical protein IQ249_09080 [Lusitaniella coriacea LEGE 07157]|uniref:Uncharacterized protein n=1 Tax=Lusitaniella coriacea LEGE 07157 TaxID=945747 RepID=A0A8J7DVU5_9CYAN|nr:hypothetical protein [Lusitaniella coriacea]MBE9116046.1 hypothetical protein [Lusitaniella coriacea LEGE 07157]
MDILLNLIMTPSVARNEIDQLGASLRRIDQKLLASETHLGGERVWYQGGEPYFDLFVELHQEQILWFQMTLRGSVLSWKRTDGEENGAWQTGKTNELKTDDVSFYAASKLIERDREPNRAFLELARDILKTRAGDDIFDGILEIFARSR